MRAFEFQEDIPATTDLDFSHLPAPIVEQRTVDTPRGELRYFLVRDDLIPGGTKTRLLSSYIATRPEKHIVMGSIFVDAGQAALALACQRSGKEAHIFVAARKERTHNTITAAELGANIVGIRPGFLSNCRAQARKFQATLPDSFLLVNKMSLPKMISCVAAQALQIDFVPKQVWTCAGSGTICRALQIAWPEAEHHTVRIGAPPNVGNATLWNSPEDFFDRAVEQPPFPTNAYYDAKAWTYFIKHASQDAMFWNVAL